MYKEYPEYQPKKSLLRTILSQRWSSLVVEGLLVFVVVVAAGRFFSPEADIVVEPPDEEAVLNLQATIDANQYELDTRTTLDLENLMELAMTHVRNQDYADGIALYDVIIDIEPNVSNHYGWRGYAFMNSGQYEQGVADYQALLDINPDSFEAYNSLCWGYGEFGDYDRALSNCDRAYELASDDLDRVIAVENRCWVNYEAGNYTQALSDCQQVFQIQPGCTHASCSLAYWNIGRVHAVTGEANLALTYYSRALRYGSRYPGMYLDIGNALYEAGWYEDARLVYERHVELAGDEANTHAKSRINAILNANVQDKSTEDASDPFAYGCSGGH